MSKTKITFTLATSFTPLLLTIFSSCHAFHFLSCNPHRLSLHHPHISSIARRTTSSSSSSSRKSQETEGIRIIPTSGGSRSSVILQNIYDDWRSDGILVETLPLDEETVQMCLDELVYSNYGKTMFGIHDAPASIGITGEISLAEINGPEVYLALSGKFWHTRSHVLGRAAMYLNARIPEIMSVSVLDPQDLDDYEQVIDECTGDVIETVDKRSVDYNGDRETMIYQGIDPDQRGPFVNYLGGGGGDFKIIPS